MEEEAETKNLLWSGSKSARNKDKRHNQQDDGEVEKDSASNDTDDTTDREKQLKAKYKKMLEDKFNEMKDKEGKWRDDVTYLRAVLNNKTNEIEKLKSQLEAATRNASRMDVSEQMLKMIKTEVDNVIFSEVKFLENDEQIQLATSDVYDLIYDLSQKKQMGDVHKARWMKTYAEHVKRFVNIKRSSGTQQVGYYYYCDWVQNKEKFSHLVRRVS